MAFLIRSVSSIGCLLWLSAQLLPAATFYPVTPYISPASSPFAGTSFSFLNLNNFESSPVSLGVTLSAGWNTLAPGALTDSVDGDDGVVDGSGTGGRSLYSFGQSLLRITFDAAVLGTLPTHAGIVWTDVGLVTAGATGFGPVTLQAFDAANNSLGLITLPLAGDGLSSGETAEDRFFGVFNQGGLSALEISMANSTDWEVDHLQYGIAAAPIPEPGTVGLLALGLSVVLLRKKRATRP